MSRKSVTQGVRRHLFGDIRPLHTVHEDQRYSGTGDVTDIPHAGEQPPFGTVGTVCPPVVAERVEGRL